MQLTVSFLALMFLFEGWTSGRLLQVYREGNSVHFALISISFYPCRPSFWQISPIKILSVRRSPHCRGTVEEEGGSDLGAFNGNK